MALSSPVDAGCERTQRVNGAHGCLRARDPDETYLVVKARLSHWVGLSPPVPGMWPRCERLPPIGLAVH